MPNAGCVNGCEQTNCPDCNLENGQGRIIVTFKDLEQMLIEEITRNNLQ